MITLPVFTPAAPPMVQHGHRMIIDHQKMPPCKVCGRTVATDAEGLCLEDWRIIVLMPWALTPPPTGTENGPV